MAFSLRATNMKTKNNKQAVILASALCLTTSSVWAMTELSDGDMSAVQGQALFVADKIVGPAGGSTFDDFTFYRVGFDAELGLNANIDSLKLGCGGVNDNLVTGKCDVDIDFLSLLGLNATRTGPGAAATSDFVLKRPYFEFAIKNDNIASQREVVGIRIGTEEATGIMSIGRQYLNGETNAENGGTCNTAGGNGNAAGRLACHSGINSISGNLGIEMSGYTSVTLTVLGINSGSGDACFGHVTAGNADAMANCGAANKFFASAVGTRMDTVVIPNIPLKVYNQTGLLAIAGNAFADVSENLRMVHRIILDASSGFGLSLQREQVSYPSFDKTSFLPAANTGWWFNLPQIAILNTAAADQTIEGVGAAVAALGEGLDLINLELNQPPADNCFGTLKFC